MDFVFDRVASGRTIKLLVIVDDATHECVAIVPEHTIGGDHLTRILDGICAQRGAPVTIRTDNVLRTEASFFSGNAHPVRDRQGCRAPCSRTSGRYPAIFRDQEIPADHSPHKVR